MKRQSAGLLLYRHADNGLEVLLVHPGGPFWAKKDKGAWSVPKGEFVEGEEPLAAAKREFKEELGVDAPEGEAVELGQAKQPSGKMVHAWALEGELDPMHIKSNMVELEWPPKSGKKQQFPEVDRAAWFPLAAAQVKILKGQVPLLETLAGKAGVTIEEPDIPEQASLF